MSDEDLKKNASYKAVSEKNKPEPVEGEEGDENAPPPPELPAYEPGTAPVPGSTPPPTTPAETTPDAGPSDV